MQPLRYRVVTNFNGKPAYPVCETDFITSAIQYSKTESRYHSQTFTIEKWFNDTMGYVEICQFYEGTEIPF